MSRGRAVRSRPTACLLLRGEGDLNPRPVGFDVSQKLTRILAAPQRVHFELVVK